VAFLGREALKVLLLVALDLPLDLLEMLQFHHEVFLALLEENHNLVRGLY